jgi:hypothetical protein
LFKTHQVLAQKFLAETTLIGVTDLFGIEFCHPIREKRFPAKKRMGKKVSQIRGGLSEVS